MMTARARLGLALLVLAAPLSAQTRTTPVSKGAWLINGSASFSRTHDDLTDQTQTNVGGSPTALMFVASHFALGGTISGSYSTSGSNRIASYGIGPSARYFFGDSTSAWLPFLSASVFPSWASTRSTIFLNGVSSQVSGDQSGLAMDASFGLTRILVSHVGATGEAYYTRFDRSTKSSGTTRDFTTNSIGVRFGLSVFLY